MGIFLWLQDDLNCEKNVFIDRDEMIKYNDKIILILYISNFMKTKREEGSLNWTISMDFSQKNNSKTTKTKQTTRGWTVTKAVSKTWTKSTWIKKSTRATTRTSTRTVTKRGNNSRSNSSSGNNRRKVSSNRGGPVRRNSFVDLNSDHFLGHAQTPIQYLSIENPQQLIKKWEKPVRLWSLLWSEQVWQCMFIEYEKDMILVDAGMEFAADEELGADYIVPDISYVKKNIRKLRWVVITHGHLDHVGALRDILPELNYPVVYTTPLALGIIKKTFDDPKEAAKIKYKMIDPDIDFLKLGCFSIEFMRVNHNIPESLALSIHTPKWIIFNSGDFKVDHTPAIDKPADLWKLWRIGTEWVKLYIGDSLGAKNPGWSVSEQVIGKNLDELIKKTKSRMIVTTFASNIGRIIQFVNSAIKYNKVVFLSGRSMVNNVEICQQLGYINVPAGYVRKLSNEANTLPDERVLILSTGAQWEEFAWLTRMARWDHAVVQLKKWDTILMSTSTIPGNEISMGKMIDNLIMKDLNVITNKDIDVHASWHGHVEDHKLFLSLLKPEFFRPYFLTASHRYAHKKIGEEMWLTEERILMPNHNGHIVEMYDDVVVVSKESLKLETILVDGKWKWHLSGEYVIKARHIMAESGIVSLIFKIDTKTKDIVWNIQIESRWFVYSSEVKELHTKVVEFARAKYNSNRKKRMDVKFNLKSIKNDLAAFIKKVIGREPMVMPMYVYINRDSKTPIKEVENSDEAIIGMTLEEQWG